ncbi:MAG: Asp23/Gls24 family envelope stress response protein [Christensenellales bacterium]
MAEIRKNEILTVTENGNVTYASEVIAIIAGLATAEIDGIAAMSGGPNLSEILGRKNFAKGVKITVVENKVSVALAVIVNYGIKIHEVCTSAQDAVRRAVENMTGLSVTDVNVSVVGIQFDKETTPVVDSTPTEK